MLHKVGMLKGVCMLQSNSQREIEESWMVYAELQRLLEQSQAQLVEQITSRQKHAEQQARELASRLEHELNLLRNRSSDLDALAHTQDKVLFLQVCECADWCEHRHTVPTFGNVIKTFRITVSGI